ncbi:MAG: flagellar biosynthesis protein FlhB [Pseudomonadota bacterium]
MAENEDGTDKSEEPTEKKKSKAREDGQVTRSKELTTLMTLLAAIIGLYFFAQRLGDTAASIFRNSYVLTKEQIYDHSVMILSFRDTLFEAIWALLPFFILLAITGILASIIIGGYNFTAKPLKPDFTKLNPLKGMKKIFGKQGLVELIKSAIKIFFLGSIAVAALWNFKADLFHLYEVAFIDAFYEVMKLVALQFFLVTLGMIIVALIDVIYQIYTNKQKLMMTKQEVKDESKNSEGNPEVKGRIRSIQRQRHVQRMMEAVPSADVIITNPTHYAVALKYDQEKGGAPIVVAKGLDILALQIVKIAKGNEVKVLEVPPLARSIYYHAEVGDEIPAGLYVAVAQVLAYIFQLKAGEIYSGTKFDDSGIDIPGELKR